MVGERRNHTSLADDIYFSIKMIQRSSEMQSRSRNYCYVYRFGFDVTKINAEFNEVGFNFVDLIFI